MVGSIDPHHYEHNRAHSLRNKAMLQGSVNNSILAIPVMNTPRWAIQNDRVVTRIDIYLVFYLKGTKHLGRGKRCFCCNVFRLLYTLFSSSVNFPIVI